MALLDVADVVQMTATLLDDPGQTTFDSDYVIPFINVRWSNLVVNLAMLGLQFSEEVVVFTIPAATLTLNNQMGPGQPLNSLMQPKRVEWKPVGAPDTEYIDADFVRALDDFPDGTQGIAQYGWRSGTVVLSKSSTPVVLRVTFDAMSTTLVDPTDQMVRGVSDIIAYRAAELIYAIRGNDKLQLKMQALGDTALDDFIAMSVMRSQGQFLQFPSMHARGGGSGRFTMAPSIP